MDNIGKTLVLFGLLIAGIGLIFMASRYMPWIGKLPGDIIIKKEKFTFYFPFATCLIISIILSLSFYLFSRK